MSRSRPTATADDTRTTTGDAVLRTEGLTKRFGGLTAVDTVDLELRENELRSVIGPNGAGKSTFFDLVSGFQPPSAGRVVFRGDDVTELTAHDRAQRGMSRSFQITDVFDSLDVRENVRIAAQATHDKRHSALRPAASLDGVADRVEAVLAEVRLTDLADVPARELAYGNQRKLEIALTLASDPDLVLLDEPTAGVGSEESDELTDLISSLAENRAVLLTEHDIDMIMTISDRITVLHEGHVIAEGEPSSIADDEAVRKAYLGTTDV